MAAYRFVDSRSCAKSSSRLVIRCTTKLANWFAASKSTAKVMGPRPIISEDEANAVGIQHTFSCQGVTLTLKKQLSMPLVASVVLQLKQL